MAKKTKILVEVVDDLDGTPLSEDQAVEVIFGWGGSSYRMDLGRSNAHKLESMIKPYVDAAEKVSSGRGRPRGTGPRRPDTGSGRSKEELAAIRAWLKQNGHEVNERGRIKADLLDLFDAAHETS